MVYHCPTLNLSTLSTSEIDLVVSTFDVTWHSVLLLTAWQYQGQKATLVVTPGGKTMLICRPLTTVLKEFFEENCIGEAENRVYYQMIDRVHATRAAVSGRYQLVPSCGTANEDVVWVMTHHLIKASCPNKRENDLLLQFQTDQTEVPLIVQIHSCGKSFLANMRTADQVTSLQLELDEYQHFRRGLACAKIERADYQRRRRLRQQLLNFNRLLWTYQHLMVMQRAFEQQQLTEAERNIIGKHVFSAISPVVRVG